MEMGAGGTAGVARRGDVLSLGNGLPGVDADAAQVSVVGLVAVAVVDHDQIAVAAVVPGGVGNDTAVGRNNGRAFAEGNVNTRMAVPVVLGDAAGGNRPDEAAGAVGGTGCAAGVARRGRPGRNGRGCPDED